MMRIPERVLPWLLVAQFAQAVSLAFAETATEPAGPAHRADAAVHFEPTDCWGTLGSRSPTYCGWFTVPADWDSLGDGAVTLPVVVYRPRIAEPGLAPVIYLAGGPGYPALGPGGGDVAAWRRAADRLFPGRELIIFDQRGSGLGTPQLNCPEGNDPQIWWDLSTDPQRFEGIRKRLWAAYRSCRDRLLAEGVDLTAFNSRQSAADVEALRRVLGHDRVVVFGISYGTRLALTVMRHYPESVAAAVLDSVQPPQAVMSNLDGAGYDAALDRLFAACAAHLDCAAAYPDLPGDLERLLTRLAQTEAVLEVDNLKSFKPLYAQVGHHLFLAILRREMQHTASLSRLPGLIAGMAKGEDWRLKPHAENIIYGSFPRDYDMGMHLSVVCHDDGERRGVEASSEQSSLSGYIAWVRSLDLCSIWPAGQAHPSDAEPVVSAVPSLLLAGALDASTTVELAETAAKTLTVSHLFVFAATAHGQLGSSDCAREVVRDFLASPRERPAPPCLATQRRPAFLALGLR